MLILFVATFCGLGTSLTAVDNLGQIGEDYNLSPGSYHLSEFCGLATFCGLGYWCLESLILVKRWLQKLLDKGWTKFHQQCESYIQSKQGEAEDYFSQSQQCKIECYKGFYVEKNAKALFMPLYKNFSNVLMERLDDTFGEKALEASGDHHEAMADDDEDNPSMEMDKENGNSKRYTTSEKEKRCLTTLGYLKAFSRQYASFSRQYSSEIWPHMDKLEEEIVTDSVHPLLKKAVYSGLRVHIDR